MFQPIVIFGACVKVEKAGKKRMLQKGFIVFFKFGDIKKGRENGSKSIEFGGIHELIIAVVVE